MGRVEICMISPDFKKLYISVIITAYDRRDFIRDAIQSALNQALEKSLYELIVIKNFYDENIDKFIEKSNIKNIILLN
ncbi:MAG: glycosyltransferase [Candidatus Micrarchaeaceae archaeon]